MSSYQTDRQWSDQYIPEIKRIVGPYLLQESPFEVDTKQASDLIVMRARDMMIACRVRRPGYEQYKHEFTIRSKRDSGAETELNKITNGWGDWMFYAHATPGSDLKFSIWHIIDLHAWRAALIRNKQSVRHGQKSNEDGTYFTWFDIRSFPKQPPITIASSCITSSPAAMVSSRVMQRLSLHDEDFQRTDKIAA